MDPKPIDFENLDSIQNLVDLIVKSQDPQAAAKEHLKSGDYPKFYEAVNKNIDSIQMPNPQDWGRLTMIFPRTIFDINGGPLALKRPVETASVSQFVTIHLKAGADLDADQVLELERLTGREIGFGVDLINIFSSTPEVVAKAVEYLGADAGEVSEPQAEGAADAEAGAKEEKSIGMWLESMEGFGKRPDAAWADGNILYSYKTVIAKRLGNKVFVNETKYSATTSKLTNAVKSIANQMGLQVVTKDEEFFGTQMMRKLGSDEVRQRKPSLKEAAGVEAAEGNWHTTAEDIALYAINDEGLYLALESCKTFQEFEDLAVNAIAAYNKVVEGFPDRHFDGDQREVAQALMEVQSSDGLSEQEIDEEPIEIEEIESASDPEERAYELGQKAFREGKKCVPVHDPEMMKMIEENKGGEVGDSIPILEAWSAGWHEANLAAPVPENSIPGKVVVRHGIYMVRYLGSGPLYGKHFHLGHDEGENEKLGKELFNKDVKFEINENDDAVDVVVAAIVFAMSDSEILGIVKKLAQKATSSGLIDDLDSAQFDAAEALYLWLDHNHGGQSSEEYEMLSALLQDGVFKPRHDLSVETLEEAGQYLYNDMENLLPEVLGQEPEAEEPSEEEPAAEPVEEEPAAEEPTAEEPVEEEPVAEEKPEDEKPPTESAAEPESEQEHLAMENRLENLERKRDQAHESGDLRKADRYNAMIEKLVEESEEGAA